jgi:Fe2+/Zn2+ uptake regulation proteins
MFDAIGEFNKYIAKSGLKNTPQRRLIIDIFFRSGKHVTTEELYEMIKAEDSGIGQATVYRTLKLLCDAGLAKEHHFGETSARYEPIEDDSHHDHLICTSCGKNIEVLDEEIERRQEELARRYSFVLTSHRMVMYGVCADCRKPGKKTARSNDIGP